MTVREISRELDEYSDQEEKKKRVAWEKHYGFEPRLHGATTPSIRKVSAKHYGRIKTRTKAEIFELCEELLNTNYVEERVIAFDWAFRLRKHYERSDFHVFESWLNKHVHNWGTCDDLCTHALGAFIFQFSEYILNVKKWAKSSDRWTRRASAVTMIYSVRRRQHLGSVFETADMLLTDQDVMVQKGYGWMLKEASNKYPKKVFNYVMKHRRKMPRTSLRYAIEKLPTSLKKEAMKMEAGRKLG